jgi:signal transduction histidine kinase
MAARTSVRRPRVALPIAAAALALAVGAVAEGVALDGEVWPAWLVAVDAVVGIAAVGAGLAAWLARPESRTGPALVAMGGIWYLGAFGEASDQRLVDLIGFPLQGWFDVLLVVLLLAVTHGGLRTRAASTIAAGVVAAHAALGLARLLLRPPNDISSCFCVGNRITGITDPGAYDAAVRIASLVEAAFAFAALLLIGARWRAATGPARRTLGALLAAGAGATAIVTYNRVLTRVVSTPVETGHTMVVVLAAGRIAVACAVAASLIRGRRTRARVADVVVSLDDRGIDGGSEALRRALADPGVRLLRWSAARRAYLDEHGAEASLPEPAAPLAATRLERDGTTLGALVHDAALREEPELLGAVLAAARLALDNERLADEVRARLEEVRASRRRIVAAGDAERRRLERDLHDGAQQQLVVVAVRLSALHRRAGMTGDVALADELDDLAAELRAATDEIRRIARGIRPPALVEGGLGPALEVLADRAPLPVLLDVRLERRPPDDVEAAAYFAAAEALANVLKHADAGQVRVEAAEAAGELTVSVSDDGRGGADPDGGSGLVGLADRLEALGGSLSVQSPGGGGTTVVARIPVAAAAAGAAQPAGVARR